MSKAKLYWLTIIALMLGIFALSTYILFFKTPLNIGAILRNKDIIDIASKIISSLAIMIGGTVTYIKFFKGRLFSEKLNLSINVKVFQASETQNLHFIDIRFENVGNVSIWEPKIFLFINSYAEGRKEEKIDLSNLNKEKKEEELQTPIIEVTENLSNHFNHLVDTDHWLVIYKLKIVSRRGNIWERCISVPNKSDYNHVDK